MNTPFSVRTLVTLRYSDMDPLGHLNNAVYSTLYEAGRVDFARDAMAAHLTGNLDTVLVRVEIDFIAEGRFPGTAEVTTRLTRIGGSSFDFAHELMLDGRLLSRAKSVCALIDTAKRKAVRFPEDLRSELLRLISPA
jgi:acyl-CoA thioester hydrolase